MTTRIELFPRRASTNSSSPTRSSSGHADLIWQLHAVYWRNKRLGHPKAVGLLIQYARAWAARNPGETAIGRLHARKTPMTQGRRP